MEGVQVNSAPRPRTVLSIGLLAVMASACDVDPKNPPVKFRLEGSLGQVMDVGYDEARILVAPEDVSLLFVRIRPLAAVDLPDGGVNSDPMMMGTTEDYPIKLAYRLLGEPQPAKGRFDLASLDDKGAQRGVVSRNVSNDPRNTLPLIVRGTISFDRDLAPDAVVTGDFNVTFENGTEAASGRTVFSTHYTAKVQP
jgi:hypothetical protein